jgi:hypothetical protein
MVLFYLRRFLPLQKRAVRKASKPAFSELLGGFLWQDSSTCEAKDSPRIPRLKIPQEFLDSSGSNVWPSDHAGEFLNHPSLTT